MFSCVFTKEDLEQLSKKLLVEMRGIDGIEYTAVDSYVPVGYSKISIFPDINSDSEGELLISIHPTGYELVIQRVCLHNRHQRGMENIYRVLFDFCRAYHFDKMKVQSVLTLDMVRWCKSHQFYPDRSENGIVLEMQNYDLTEKEMQFSGDYIKKL